MGLANTLKRNAKTTRKPNRAILVKVIFAGIALIATQLSVTQLDLVRRVISEQLLDLPPAIANDGTIDPRQDIPPQLPTPSNDVNNNVQKQKGYAEVQRPIVGQSYRNANINMTAIEQRNRKRAKFQTDRWFSDELIDEFIQGAKQDAYLRKRRRQRAKEQQKKKQKNKKKPERVPLKVPYPIFVPSLPKSGTTTAHQYFTCGGQRSVHLAGRNDDSIFKIGRCAQRNVREDRAPFAGCGDYDVWTDTGRCKMPLTCVPTCCIKSTLFPNVNIVSCTYAIL